MLEAALDKNIFPVEQRSHLRLVAKDGGLIDSPAPEDELARRRAQRHAGRVAIEALQTKFDAITEIAEGVDGQMRAPIEVTSDGSDFYGPDGRSMTETADNGLSAARREAEVNPNLKFEVPRRQEERKEIDVVKDAFATGKANTVFITTDFPHALEGASEDIGGYKVHRKLALNRVWMKDSSGKIMLVSQTLDGSNRQALEAIHTYLGFKVEEGELLSQRRLMSLSDEEQRTLINRTTNVYDQDLERQFGGTWYAGRQPIDYRNTFEFAQGQQDLIDIYAEARISGRLTQTLMYDLLATANARFEKYQSRKKKQSSTSVLSAAGVETSFNMTSYSRATVAWEMQVEGRSARRAGKTFSACGSTYTSTGSAETTEYSMTGAGFGRSGEKRHWSGGKIHRNTECRSCKKVKKEVGACHICEDCVNNPKKHSRDGITTAKRPASYTTTKSMKSNHQKKSGKTKTNTTAKSETSYTLW